MATKLRLEIHRITLQKKVEGKKSAVYQNCNFFELIDQFDKDDKQKALSSLWTKFVEQFDDKFCINTEGDKAVTATNNCNHTVASEKNTINGEVYGGPTNREQSIYKQTDAKKSRSHVDADDVVSSRFYIKLWLPYNYSSGALMIQSYSTANISDLVKVHFAKFVQKYGFKLMVTSYYPKSFMEERNKQSNVISVTYVKDNISEDKRRLINPIFAEFKDLKIRIEVTGFKKSVSEFWDVFKKDGRTLGTNIDPLEIKMDDNLTVVARYEDEEGRVTTMNIDNERLRNFSYYMLPVEIMVTGKNTYDFNKISKHTDFILETIKKEIGYRKAK